MTEVNKKKTEKRFLIQLRTTEENHKNIKLIAKELGMTMSGYMLLCSLKIPPRIRKAKPDREILLKIMKDLGRIGTNVSQIEKVMNSDIKTFSFIAIREELVAQTLDGLNILSSHVLEVLGKTSVHDIDPLVDQQSKKKPKPYREALLKFMKELGRIGKDINQIAKSINSDIKTLQSISISETQISEVFNSLNNLLSGAMGMLEQKDEHDSQGENKG